MDRIKEIEARLQAATPGPWRIGISALITDGAGCALFHGKGAKGNAEFIANSREDIPYLLDEIKRLRDELDKYENMTAEDYGEMLAGM